MDLTSMHGARTGRAVSKGGGLLSGFAAVALFGAMLVLAACGNNDSGSAQAQTGTMNTYNGYFLTQGRDGEIGCFSEDLTVTENANGTVESQSIFTSVTINHRGYKASNVDGDGDPTTEIFGLGYAAVADDGFENPGVYYLQKTSDNPVMYGGLWIGQPNLPMEGSEGMICPYVMFPDPDDEDAGDCSSSITDMLGDTCYRTNNKGFVNPTAIQ